MKKNPIGPAVSVVAADDETADEEIQLCWLYFSQLPFIETGRMSSPHPGGEEGLLP